jgi:superoxide dismutase, Fe-Mn family
MERRQFLQGTLLSGLALMMPKIVLAAEGPRFTLPPIGYAYSALEPELDTKTMEIHHTKHHASYVEKLNQALKDNPGDWSSWSLEDLLLRINELPAKLKPAVKNHAGGHHNHLLWWESIMPGDVGASERFLKLVDDQWGGMKCLQNSMEKEAMGRFGSGWAWLCQNDKRELSVFSTANQDSPLSSGLRPLLGIDVWEHAYYLKFQNRRADYFKAVWALINWQNVSQRVV